MSTSEAGQETTCEVEELRRQMAELRRELAQHQSSQTQASKLGWAREPGIDFLAHAGEMGERIRAFDWASTSLGPIENWPESLRTAMSLCLKSPFPTLIYWGSEFLYIYNDAQIPVVGNRHPDALGRPFKEARPEIWPVVRPIVEDVFATGKAARVDDLLLVHRRSGYLEEEYDTCCYTPIMQESGEVGGIFTVVTTTTERVIAQRRLRTRRDLAALNAQGKGAEEVCRMVAQVLAGNSYDIPFALLYLVEDGRQRARLVAAVGIDEGTSASPRLADLADSAQAFEVWPLTRVARSGKNELVAVVEERVGALPKGPWEVPPRSAALLPVTLPGQRSPTAILVVAVSPVRPLDAAYEIFLNAVAAEISTILANVRAYEEEAQFRQIAEGLPQIVWIARPDGWVEYFNHRWSDYTGLALRQSEGWGWSTALHPDDLLRSIDVWTHATQTGTAFEIEYRFKRASDGSYRWHLGRGLPVRDLEGKITKWFGTCTDIHDQKEALEALEQAKLAAEELDRAKTAFFSNVSHEFRTPLTLLLGPLEDLLTRQGAALDPKDLGALEMARRNALRLHKLVNSLLDFSRLEASRVQAVCEPVDLAALTTDLASVFRAAVERAGLRLVIECAPLADVVYVDREMWEKIVLNLLSNAFKFTFDGEIRVAVCQAGEAVELSVRDTGIGIPQEDLPHIFERFHLVKGARSRTHEGTGIGLALVQELVRLHGGRVRAESVYGQGSTFIVSVPLGKGHLPAEHVGGPRTQASTATTTSAYVEEAVRWLPEDGNERQGLSLPRENRTGLPLGGFRTKTSLKNRARIVLADDNADMRAYIRSLLSEEYEVTAVEDGEVALAAVRRSPPDLVLTDIMMPRLDGLGLLKEIRCDPALTAIPVILLSALAEEESKVEGLERGADDYLTKPFSARELRARVAAHTELARLRAEAVERETSRLLKSLFHALSSPVTVLDREGNITYTSKSWEDLMETCHGWTGSVSTGANYLEIWRTAARQDSEAQQAVAGVEAVLVRSRSAFVGEYSLPTASGRRWFLLQANPMPPEHGGVVLSHVDITERRQAEDALRQSEQALRESYGRIEDLAGRLIVAHEEERKRIARELHDDLSQEVAALAIGLGRLERQVPKADDAVRSQMMKLEDRIIGLSDHIRRLSHELHSATLEHAGLAEALKSYCSEFTEETGIAVSLDIQNGAGTMPPSVALCLYRVAQESLRNIAKHSGARSAEVRLASRREAFELRIADRGVGLRSGGGNLSRGLGLASMEERVKLLDGSLEIKSQPGAGTELTARIPSGAKYEKSKGAAG